MYQRLMAGFDGSDASRRALDRALALAKEWSAALWVLIVQEHLPKYSDDPSEVTEEREAIHHHSLELKQEAEQLAAGAGVQLQARIVTGNAPRLLCDVAKQEGIEPILIGHKVRSGLWGGLLGGTVDKVVDHAPCSVLVVRS